MKTQGPKDSATRRLGDPATRRPEATGLQPLTAADLDYIRALADEHSVGLEQRCARYRRRASLRRTAVAACIFFGCCFTYSSSMAAPLYEQITTSGQAGIQHICDTIRLTIENV